MKSMERNLDNIKIQSQNVGKRPQAKHMVGPKIKIMGLENKDEYRDRERGNQTRNKLKIKLINYQQKM